MRIKAALMLITLIAASGCQARQPAPRLTNGGATKAFRTMMGMHRIEVLLGTCKPAKEAEFEGQTACTLLGVSPGAMSETQADFHWNGQEWVANVSSSQSILPFPDKVFMNIHSDTKIDPNAGPIR